MSVEYCVVEDFCFCCCSKPNYISEDELGTIVDIIKETIKQYDVQLVRKRALPVFDYHGECHKVKDYKIILNGVVYLLATNVSYGEFHGKWHRKFKKLYPILYKYGIGKIQYHEETANKAEFPEFYREFMASSELQNYLWGDTDDQDTRGFIIWRFVPVLKYINNLLNKKIVPNIDHVEGMEIDQVDEGMYIGDHYGELLSMFPQVFQHIEENYSGNNSGYNKHNYRFERDLYISKHYQAVLPTYEEKIGLRDCGKFYLKNILIDHGGVSGFRNYLNSLSELNRIITCLLCYPTKMVESGK